MYQHNNVCTSLLAIANVGLAQVEIQLIDSKCVSASTLCL